MIKVFLIGVCHASASKPKMKQLVFVFDDSRSCTNDVLWTPPLHDAGEVYLLRIICNEWPKLEDRMPEVAIWTLEYMWLQHLRSER